MVAKQSPAIGPVVAFILYLGPNERPSLVNEMSGIPQIRLGRQPIAVKHQFEHAGKPIYGREKLRHVRRLR